jgi:hypothetical protein
LCQQASQTILAIDKGTEYSNHQYDTT